MDTYDCYKVLFKDWFTPSANILGLNAQWIDNLDADSTQCGASDTQGPATLQDWFINTDTFVQDIFGSSYAFGTDDADSAGYVNFPGCWTFADWSDWAPYVAQVGLNYL